MRKVEQPGTLSVAWSSSTGIQIWFLNTWDASTTSVALGVRARLKETTGIYLKGYAPGSISATGSGSPFRTSGNSRSDDGSICVSSPFFVDNQECYRR